MLFHTQTAHGVQDGDHGNAYIGSYNVADGLTYTNHNDKYSIDESSICRGVAMYAQFAADYLEANV